jgi:hypothetical protein
VALGLDFLTLGIAWCWGWKLVENRVDAKHDVFQFDKNSDRDARICDLSVGKLREANNATSIRLFVVLFFHGRLCEA